jgi:hypothetical protein
MTLPCRGFLDFEDTLAALLSFVGRDVVVDVSALGLRRDEVVPVAFQAGVLRNVVDATHPELGRDMSFLVTVGDSGAFYLDRSTYEGSVWLHEDAEPELLVWMGPFVISLHAR